MNKGKIIIYIAALLIIVNIALLAIGMLKPPPTQNKREKSPKTFIIEKLSLNEEQIKEFELLIIDHREKVKTIEKKGRENKQNLFNTLINSNISKDSILNEVAKNQMEIENVHLNHFEEIKEICNSEQIPAFNELIQEMGSILMKPKHRDKKRL